MDVLDILPDEPACLEARAMILARRGEIIWRSHAAIVLHAARERLVTIVGRFRWPSLADVLGALADDVEIVTRESEFAAAGALPSGWVAERALVHHEPARLPEPPAGHRVTFFTGSDAPDLRHVPAALREELEAALAFSPMAAALDGDVPVAFCYAAWETETWWDVSIDTLERWRGRGFATAASAALMAYMRRRSKRAVWAALESNLASLGVARRLRFERIGKLIVVRRTP